MTVYRNRTLKTSAVPVSWQGIGDLHQFLDKRSIKYGLSICYTPAEKGGIAYPRLTLIVQSESGDLSVNDGNYLLHMPDGSYQTLSAKDFGEQYERAEL